MKLYAIFSKVWKDNWKKKVKKNNWPKKDKHLNKEDFEKIQETIKKVDKEIENKKKKTDITTTSKITVSEKDREENRKFLTNDENKEKIEKVHTSMQDIASLYWNSINEKKVKGNMNIYALVTTIILSINAVIILQFNIIKEYLYKQLNYNISLFIVLIVMNLIIVWIIYTYKKLSQNK